MFPGLKIPKADVPRLPCLSAVLRCNNVAKVSSVATMCASVTYLFSRVNFKQVTDLSSMPDLTKPLKHGLNCQSFTADFPANAFRDDRHMEARSLTSNVVAG